MIAILNANSSVICGVGRASRGSFICGLAAAAADPLGPASILVAAGLAAGESTLGARRRRRRREVLLTARCSSMFLDSNRCRKASRASRMPLPGSSSCRRRQAAQCSAQIVPMPVEPHAMPNDVTIHITEVTTTGENREPSGRPTFRHDLPQSGPRFGIGSGLSTAFRSLRTKPPVRPARGTVVPAAGLRAGPLALSADNGRTLNWSARSPSQGPAGSDPAGAVWVVSWW